MVPRAPASVTAPEAWYARRHPDGWPDTVALWWIDLTAPDAAAESAAHADLTPAEQARAARLRLADKRRQFILTRAVLRRILSASLSGIAPRDIPLAAERGQRPAVTAPGAPSFSVTHTDGAAAIAICESATAVGIDLEPVRTVRHARAIALRHFAPDELAAFHCAGDTNREFLRIWTRKEALFKACGGQLPADSRQWGAAAPTGHFVATFELGPYSLSLALAR